MRERGGEGVDTAEEFGVRERKVSGGVDEDGGGEREVVVGAEEREDILSNRKRGGFQWKRVVVTEGVEGFGGGAVTTFGINK